MQKGDPADTGILRRTSSDDSQQSDVVLEHFEQALVTLSLPDTRCDLSHEDTSGGLGIPVDAFRVLLERVGMPKGNIKY